MRLQLLSDRFGDFALNSECVSQIAGVRLCPEMRVVAGIDQLRIYSDLVGDALNAPFQDMGDAQCLADLPKVARNRSLILHHARAADHLQVRDLGQISRTSVMQYKASVADRK